MRECLNMQKSLNIYGYLAVAILHGYTWTPILNVTTWDVNGAGSNMLVRQCKSQKVRITEIKRKVIKFLATNYYVKAGELERIKEKTGLKVTAKIITLRSQRCKNSVGVIEQMQQVVEAGNWGQMNSVRAKILHNGAWHEMQVLGAVSGEDGWKLGANLSQMASVPHRSGPIHRWGNNYLKGAAAQSKVAQKGVELTQNRVDGAKNSPSVIGTDQKGGQTLDDANCWVNWYLTKRLSESVQSWTINQSGSSHGLAGGGIHCGHVPPDVGVPDDGVQLGRRHAGRNLKQTLEKERGKASLIYGGGNTIKKNTIVTYERSRCTN